MIPYSQLDLPQKIWLPIHIGVGMYYLTKGYLLDYGVAYKVASSVMVLWFIGITIIVHYELLYSPWYVGYYLISAAAMAVPVFLRGVMKGPA